MIVVMEPDAPETAIEKVIAYLISVGFDVHRSSGQSRSILGVVGDVTSSDVAVVRELSGVAEVVRVTEPFRLASRRFKQSSTIVEGPWGTIGGERPWIAVEPIGLGGSRLDAPRRSRSAVGDDAPPSTDLPYEIAAGRPFDAAVTRSRLCPDSIGSLACLALDGRASSKWPVRFVERAPSWGANAWIGAAEKELERGETCLVLLEAGGEYPNGARTLEVAAIARAKLRTHLPIVVDVPTIAQRARYSSAVACAAIAAGADGVILRVWAGREDDVLRVPATSTWQDAIELAEKLRNIGAAVRR